MRAVAASWVLTFPLFCFIVIEPTSGLAQWWNPFAPNDYEECAETAARDAKSKEALSILIDSCKSKFAGRRKPSGGYTFFDPRQSRAFDIEGPNPTRAEMEEIDNAYSDYRKRQEQREAERKATEARLAEQARRAEEERRAEEARRMEQERQAALVRQAAEDEQRRDFERRKATAKNYIKADSRMLCEFGSCRLYRIDVTLYNGSKETLSQVGLGWAFLPSPDARRPSSYQTRYVAPVALGPGDTTVVNIDEYDGPSETNVAYCVGVTGIDLQR